MTAIDAWQETQKGRIKRPFVIVPISIGGNQPPQWRTGPQSMCTKFDRE